MDEPTVEVIEWPDMLSIAELDDDDEKELSGLLEDE